MPNRLTEPELRALRDHSRRHGREAAERAPLDPTGPPEDLRPLSGLPMPRGLPVDVLTASEIAAVAEAWRSGYRQVMTEREAGGEKASPDPLLWWSPAVPGGWPEGWRWQDAAAPPGHRAGPVRPGGGPTPERGAAEEEVRGAARLSAPGRAHVDWEKAEVRRD